MKKKELREKYKKLRSELSFAELEVISARIVFNFAMDIYTIGKKISVFIPIEKFNEVNTWTLLETIEEDLFLPVIQPDNKLKHIRFSSKEQLKKNNWGILEPQYGDELDVSNIDIVIVPLLTIDKTGNRVGYGKGYYDNFLAQCKPDCIFVGLYQFDELEVIDDLHESDIPLHYCITPTHIIKF